MRLVIQRVTRAAVTIDGGETRSIGGGLMVLMGICTGDDEATCAFMADKMAGLRIFDDPSGNLNLSLMDIGGECLLISNFTLYAQCKKGRRPSFIEAASPAQAKAVYESFIKTTRALGVERLETGEFGAHMAIDMVCDGPVTILLDSDLLKPRK